MDTHGSDFEDMAVTEHPDGSWSFVSEEGITVTVNRHLTPAEKERLTLRLIDSQIAAAVAQIRAEQRGTPTADDPGGVNGH